MALTKQPAERLDYDVDFSKRLAGATISSILSYVATRLSDGVDVTATLVASSPAPSILPGAKKVRLRLIDGAHGQQYEIVVKVQTSDGQEAETEFRLDVNEVRAT